MSLSEYLSEIAALIDQLSQGSLVLSTELISDFRSDKNGVIKGTMISIDDSVLYFTEYIDMRLKIEKLSYSYHYQLLNGDLIFRYYNSEHKPRLDFMEHKHLQNGVELSRRTAVNPPLLHLII